MNSRKIDLKKTGIELIAEEQQRVREQEGFTLESDKQYKNNELVKGAISYLRTPMYNVHIQTGQLAPMEFPFKQEWWKPSPDDRIKELIKAGQMIASEIDKLRLEKITIL